MSNLYRGPSIDPFYQFSIHFLGQAVSEDKIQIWKVNRQQTPSDDKSSYYLSPYELKSAFIIYFYIFNV
jgi:hypothetical protein